VPDEEPDDGEAGRAAARLAALGPGLPRTASLATLRPRNSETWR
jgi:hypothetical protein